MTSPSTRFTMAPAAHSKALLHASRFPWAAVTGLLLGRDGDRPGEVRIEDAVPLFHSAVLAPSLEVACMLVEEHCKTLSKDASKPWRIVGVYAADDKLAAAAAPSPVVERLASQVAIKSKGTKCCLLVVDNQALASESKPSFLAYLPSGAEWKPASSKAFDIEADCNSLFTQRLRSAKTVFDFDDHFSNVVYDWRNLDFAA